MTEQTVVPVMTAGRRLSYVAAALIPLALGVSVLIALVTGNIRAEDRVLLGVCAGLAVLLGLVLVAAAVKVLPRRDLLIGSQGIGMVHRGGRSFLCAWDELESVQVTYVGRTPYWAFLSTWRVHLELVPADQNFGRRHPDMTVWLRPGRAGYRILLGPYKSLITPLDAALGQHAPGIYQGAVRER